MPQFLRHFYYKNFVSYDIVSEKASFYSVQEVEEKLDKIIDKYEDNI
ncbi:MAG: hypothetical protein K8R54_10190 [Bacteroidales bacterium]|nr:hypothetical protein [Bacteroidales bacterium]